MIEIDYLEQMKPFPPGEDCVTAIPRLRWHKDRRRFINLDLAFIADIRPALIITIDEDGTEQADLREAVEFFTVDGLSIFTLKTDKLMSLIDGTQKSQNRDVQYAKRNEKFDVGSYVPMNERILETTKQFGKKGKDKDSWN